MRLWIAQGFGVGRIPFAPGTFGSVLGVGWFFLLMTARSPWVLGFGALGGIALSVWLCGFGERKLGQKDPGSVVLDEIAALPVCFLFWVGYLTWSTGVFPRGMDFLSHGRVWLTVGTFAAFRVFDIAKPWPVRQSQVLPGGWGITVDDLLAALYVNLVALLAWIVHRFAG